MLSRLGPNGHSNQMTSEVSATVPSVQEFGTPVEKVVFKGRDMGLVFSGVVAVEPEDDDYAEVLWAFLQLGDDVFELSLNCQSLLIVQALLDGQVPLDAAEVDPKIYPGSAR
jgi:hypothetical protein